MTEAIEARSGTFVVIARRQYDVTRRAEFERILEGVVAHDEANEPDTLVQSFHFEEPNWFWSYEVYASEDAYRAHVAWHDAQPWWPRVVEILGGLGGEDSDRQGARHFCTGTIGKGVPFKPYEPVRD